jgi:hypothetical protein
MRPPPRRWAPFATTRRWRPGTLHGRAGLVRTYHFEPAAGARTVETRPERR